MIFACISQYSIQHGLRLGMQQSVFFGNVSNFSEATIAQFLQKLIFKLIYMKRITSTIEEEFDHVTSHGDCVQQPIQISGRSKGASRVKTCNTILR